MKWYRVGAVVTIIVGQNSDSNYHWFFINENMARESFFYDEENQFPKIGEFHSSQWDRMKPYNTYDTLRSQNSRIVFNFRI